MPRATVSGRRPHLTTLRVVRDSRFAARAGQEVAREAFRMALTEPSLVYQCMAPYAEREAAEAFWILPLDIQAKVIGSGPTVITRGTLDSTLVDSREVFSAALLVKAAAVILCHNHPSGDPTPSQADREVTRKLVHAGELLDVPVRDHVIIGRGNYVSFAVLGLL